MPAPIWRAFESSLLFRVVGYLFIYLFVCLLVGLGRMVIDGLPRREADGAVRHSLDLPQSSSQWPNSLTEASYCNAHLCVQTQNFSFRLTPSPREWRML